MKNRKLKIQNVYRFSFRNCKFFFNNLNKTNIQKKEKYSIRDVRKLNRKITQRQNKENDYFEHQIVFILSSIINGIQKKSLI